MPMKFQSNQNYKKQKTDLPKHTMVMRPTRQQLLPPHLQLLVVKKKTLTQITSIVKVVLSVVVAMSQIQTKKLRQVVALLAMMKNQTVSINKLTHRLVVLDADVNQTHSKPEQKTLQAIMVMRMMRKTMATMMPKMTKLLMVTMLKMMKTTMMMMMLMMMVKTMKKMMNK